MSIQRTIMNVLGIKEKIDPKVEIRSRIDFLKAYLKKTKANGFVLGISGGQDSTLAGKLAQMAVDELNNEINGRYFEFIALRLPYGTQNDEDDAQEALKFINPSRSLNFNVKKPVDALDEAYKDAIYSEYGLTDYHKGNVKARMRMIAQYAIAGEENLLVIGTDHAAEAVTGFFTKYGDGGADILPLSGLTKRQGKALLKELGTPEKLYLKAPTADLLDYAPQQTDETELGITYDQLDDYLEGKEVSDEVVEKIEKRYTMTQHKRELPVSPLDDWWK